MNNFRREKKISDVEINTFKDEEISKIIKNTETPTKNSWFKRPMILASTFALTALLIVLSIFIFNPSQELQDYTVTKLSYNEYKIESKVNNQNFNLYYKTSVVHPGERQSYNDTFEYYTPYVYASDDIARQYEVEFNVFKLSPTRYFLEVKFNNESTYIETNYHTDHGLDKLLKDLEIDDLEEDIKDIYELIDLYPPVPNHTSTYPRYTTHPDIDELANSKAKRNYTQYVENYYIPQDYNVDDDASNNRTITVLQRHMITVDEEGDYIESDLFGNYAFGIDLTFDDIIPDYDSRIFAFYLTGEDKPFHSFGRSLNNDNYNVNGYYRIGDYNNQLYVYSYISLPSSNVNLDDVSYGEVTYTLSEDFDYLEGSFEFNPLYYNQALIIPPVIIANKEDTSIVFDTFTYKFYDENDQLIHEFTK